MKKYIYGALLVLVCPLVLNTQQALASEEGTSEEVAAVTETTLPQADPTIGLPSSEESEVAQAEELTETTEESTEASTEETTTDSEEVSSETTTEESTEASTETSGTESETETTVDTEETTSDTTTEETSTLDEEVITTETSESEAETPATKVAATVDLNVTFVTADGTAISSGAYSGTEGELGYIDVPAGYVVSAISDASFFSSYDSTTKLARIYGTLSPAVTDLTVTVAPTTEASVLINFVDAAGDPMINQSSVLLTGVSGDAYKYQTPTITGYSGGGTELTGTYTDELVSIDVVYTPVETTLTVVYLDEAGNKLKDDETFTGKYGEVYNLTPAWFVGLDLLSLNGTAMTEADLPVEVTMTDADQTFTFVFGKRVTYVPAPVDPVAPLADPIADPAPNVTQPVSVAVTKVADPAPLQDKLPETGTKENSMLITMAGIALVVQGAYVFKKRQENDLEG